MKVWVRVRQWGMAAAFAVALFSGVAASALLGAAPAAAQTVSAIVVEGNQRVDADTIRSYVPIRPGDRADPVRIDEALKALYATGIFEDVQIRVAGGRLIVTVREAQVINRIAFEGNKQIKDDALTGEIQSKVRSSLSRPTVQSDVQRIVEVYRRGGRYDVTVEPKIIERPNNRVDLIFEIREGNKTTIRSINFTGNNAFSSAKLRDIINTTQANLLSFLRNSDVYDPDRVNADQELLRRFYLKSGYADFRILSATVDLDRANNGFVLNFVVDEGAQYRFGTVDILSNVRDLNTDSIRGLLRTNSGDVYNAELVEKTVELVTIELAKRGYAFAQVRPRGDRDFQGRLINIVFVLEEGPRVYVERINVRGNSRTREYVIRREFDLFEGDAYNRVLVDRAERRLKNLGYFKTVRITNEQGSAADRVILNVDVEEQLTGEFSVAVGFSSADGILGELTLGERNFLGRGQYVRTSIQYGQRSQGVEFSFTEPYFMDYRLAAGFDVFFKKQESSSFVSYGVDTVGGTLRLGMQLNEEVTLQLRYSAFQREISLGTNSAISSNLISSAVLAGFNQAYLTSAVGYSLTYNGLDNNKDPTAGLYATFAQDFAGAGGDAQYVKSTFDARAYRPITGDFVGMVRVQGGHIFEWGSESLRVLDHFNNASSIVRGFAVQGFGPRDLNPPGGFRDAIGGTTYWAATAEVQFPLFFLPKEIGIKSAVFFDVGSLYGYDGPTGPVAPNNTPVNVFDDASVRASTGVSLIWQSPFGPLRFDLAYPIAKGQYDKTQFFRFGGGGKF